MIEEWNLLMVAKEQCVHIFNTLSKGGEGSLMEGTQRDRGYMGLAIKRDDASVMDHYKETKMVGIR